MMLPSLSAAVTTPGLAISATIATRAVAMAARACGVPSTLMKDQTPVPLRDLPDATEITLSMAVCTDGERMRQIRGHAVHFFCVQRTLMVQKITASGWVVRRAMAVGVCTRATGATWNASAGARSAKSVRTAIERPMAVENLGLVP